MNLIEYIGLHLDMAIEMLMNPEKSRAECMCFLMNFKKQLFKPEEVIVDEDKKKYLEV